MKSPFSFITKPATGRRYDNVKQIGGIDFITSSSEEDHLASNRFAEVIAVPLGYPGPIVPGDTLLVHHNVFKFYNDIKSRRKSGKSFFRDDIFLVDVDQYFMYKHNETWTAVDRYCFVEPIPVTDSFLKKGCSNEPLTGVMRYPNEYLRNQGVIEGMTVCFTPESEYEFNVEGKKLYRIFDHQITIAL